VTLERTVIICVNWQSILVDASRVCIHLTTTALYYKIMQFS